MIFFILLFLMGFSVAIKSADELKEQTEQKYTCDIIASLSEHEAIQKIKNFPSEIESCSESDYAKLIDEAISQKKGELLLALFTHYKKKLQLLISNDHQAALLCKVIINFEEPIAYKLTESLLENYANPNPIDVYQSYPLAWAIFKGYKEIIPLLIMKGADIRRKTYIERPPYYSSVLLSFSSYVTGHLLQKSSDVHKKEIIELLLKYGANPYSFDCKDLILAADSWNDLFLKYEKTTLFDGRILVGKLPSINKPHNVLKTDLIGRTLLHFAVLSGEKELVVIALELKNYQGQHINFNAQDSAGKTALHYAVECFDDTQAHELVKILLKYAKDLNINTQDCRGDTALHYAVRKNMSKTAEELFEKGALEIENFLGLTPSATADPSMKKLCEIWSSSKKAEDSLFFFQLMMENEEEFEKEFQKLSEKGKLVLSHQLLTQQTEQVKRSLPKILALLLNYIEDLDDNQLQELLQKIIWEKDFLHQFIQYYPSDDKRLKIVADMYLKRFSVFTVNLHGSTLLDIAIEQKKENIYSLLCEKIKHNLPKENFIRRALIITHLYEQVGTDFNASARKGLLLQVLGNQRISKEKKEVTLLKLQSMFEVCINYYHYDRHNLQTSHKQAPLPPLEDFIALVKKVDCLKEKKFKEIMQRCTYATAEYKEAFRLASSKPSQNLETLLSLLEATKSCPVSVIQFFLDKDKDINLNCLAKPTINWSHKDMQEGKTTTVLNYALEQKNVDTIKFLVNQGIRPSSFDRGGGEEDALHYFIEKYINFPSQDSLDKIELMLKGGVNPNQKVKDQGSALYWAFEKAYELKKIQIISPLIKVLLAYQANLDDQVEEKRLIERTQDKNMEEVHLLIERAQESKIFPLHFAATFKGKTEKDFFERLEHLVKKCKCNVNQRNRSDETALECALKRGFDATYFFKLQGAFLNEKNRKGETLLITSIKNSFSETIVRNLIHFGANVTEKDTLGRTALHWCALMGKTEEAKTEEAKKMVEVHPSIDFINEKDNEGNTALHYACGQENIDLSLYLLENGANLFSKNHENKIPIELTASYKLRETIIRSFKYHQTIKELFSKAFKRFQT